MSIDLETGERREIARLPDRTGPLSVSPDGRWLAGVAKTRARGPETRPSRVVLIDVSGSEPQVLTTSLERRGRTGRALWLSDDRFMVVPPSGARWPMRLFDTRLRPHGRSSAVPVLDAILAGGNVAVLRPDARVVTGTPPRVGTQLAVLPGKAVSALAWVPDGPSVDQEVAGSDAPVPTQPAPASISEPGPLAEAAPSTPLPGEGGEGRGRWVTVLAIALLAAVLAAGAAALVRRRRAG